MGEEELITAILEYMQKVTTVKAAKFLRREKELDPDQEEECQRNLLQVTEK